MPFAVYAVPERAASAAGRYDGKGEVFVHHDIPDDDDDFDDDRFPQLSVSTLPTGEAHIQKPRELLVSMLDGGFHYTDPRSGLVSVAPGW